MHDSAPAPASAPLEWSHIFVGSRCRTTCQNCGEAHISDVDVNIGYHVHMNSKPEMFLRVIGTRINATVERSDEEVVQCLSYLAGLVDQVVKGADTLYVHVTDPSFNEHVVSILGAVELLRCADLQWDREGQALFFLHSAHQGQPTRWVSRKASAVLRLLREELSLLHRGQRRHTRCVSRDLEARTEEFHELQAEYQRSDSYPSFADFNRWVGVRDFFAMAGQIVTDRAVAHQHLTYAEHASRYCERVLSYIELHNASESYRPSSGGVLSNCAFSEDLQMARYLRRAEDESKAGCETPSGSTIAPASGASTPIAPLSPECTRSPGVTLTRTPSAVHKRRAFQMALPPPSPSCLVREPGSEYAGLLNVVQNCFMNCLLQAYYTCRQFTHTVLSYPTGWVEGGTRESSPQAKVIQRLQAVFAYLEMSSASCVNPEHVLEAVGAANPHFMNGGQHDPQEFADAFIDMLSRGFEMLDVGDAPGGAELVRQLQDLVYGETVEVSVDRSGKHTSSEGRVERTLHFVPLYLPGESDEARGGLAATPYVVRHATPAPEAPATTDPLPPCPAPAVAAAASTPLSLLAGASAPQLHYLRALAEVAGAGCVEEEEEGEGASVAGCDGGDDDLVLGGAVFGEEVCPASPPPMRVPQGMVSLYSALDQLAIDFKDEAASTQATLKSFRKLPHLLMFFLPARTMGNEERELCFDPTIYLDRYVDQEEANAARDKCRALLAEHQDLERELARSEQAVAEMQKVVDAACFTEEHAANMRQIYTAQCGAVEDVRCSIERNRSAVRKTYKEVGRREQNTYHLHAVIVHKRIGSDCGHYFSYALDTRRSSGDVREWIKFDDTRVSRVSEKEVFSAETRRNVYCMFYESSVSSAKSREANVVVPRSLADIISHEDRRWEGKVQQRCGPQQQQPAGSRALFPTAADLPVPAVACMP